MMRWSFQLLHGCVPVHASAIPSESANAPSWSRRSIIRSAASGKLSQRPVLISTSEAISSPTRCGSSSSPAAAPFSSSKRFVSSSVSGSRRANSSSTATSRSSAFSKASRANAICSSGDSRWASPTELSYLKRFQQPRGDALPAPAFHGRASRSATELGAHLCRKSEQLVQLRRELPRVARLEAREVPVRLRVFRLESFRDLGQPRVARDERRRSSGSRLGGDHAERLREDGRDDGDVGERQQVHEVAVLERTGEQRPRRSRPLELVAVVAEPDDDGARVDLPQRLKQD